MRVLIIQFLPGYTDFIEHFGEVLALVVGERAKGALSKADAGRLVDAGVFPAGFGQANGELSSILGVTAALDEAVDLELGQDLGKRPGLRSKCMPSSCCDISPPGCLASRQMMGALPDTPPP